MPVIVQKEWFTKEQIQKDRDILYLFGDNVQRVGKGGQAKVCRDEPNCIGVATKLAPTYQESDYMSDDKLAYNIATISRDFLPIIFHLQKGKTVVFPADGIGTGIAKLPEKAPLTYAYIQSMWDYCIMIGNNIAAK